MNIAVSMTLASNIIKPPFNEEKAIMKVKNAQDAWNSREPERVAKRIPKIPNGVTGPNSLPEGRP